MFLANILILFILQILFLAKTPIFDINKKVFFTDNSLIIFAFFLVNAVLFLMTIYIELWKQVGRPKSIYFILRFVARPFLGTFLLSKGEFYIFNSTMGYRLIFLIMVISLMDLTGVIGSKTITNFKEKSHKDIDFFFGGKFPESSHDLFFLDIVLFICVIFFIARGGL